MSLDPNAPRITTLPDSAMFEIYTEKTLKRMLYSDFRMNNLTFANVRNYGARGNAVDDDLININNAINDADVIYFPNGTYTISSVDKMNITSGNKVLWLEPNATIKKLPSNNETHQLLDITNTSNVVITGGTIQGERQNHIGSTGEHGLILRILSSSNVLIDGVTIKDAWGDGVYVSDDGVNTTIGSENVTLRNLIVDNNRRNGISLIHCHHVYVQNVLSKNTNGTNPESGIDLEPNAGDSISYVYISDSRFEANNDKGLVIDAVAGTVGYVTVTNTAVVNNNLDGMSFNGVTDLLLHGCFLTDNGNPVEISAARFANTTRAKVIGNSVVNNYREGINFVSGNTFFSIIGNTCTGNGANAIRVNENTNNRFVISNNITHTNGGGIAVTAADRGIVSNNISPDGISIGGSATNITQTDNITT